MALTPKHAGFGKWKVLDGETIVAENMTRVEAFEMAGMAVEEHPSADASPIPMVDEDGNPLSDTERRRIYEKRLSAGLKNTDDRLLEPYHAMLLSHFEENTAEYIWRQLEPILKAGAEGARRELGTNMKVRTAA